MYLHGIIEPINGVLTWSMVMELQEAITLTVESGSECSSARALKCHLNCMVIYQEIPFFTW